MKEMCRVAAVATIMITFLAGLTALNAQASRIPGITLPPLDAAAVDDILQSSNGATRATIKFVNQSRSAVDIYWIDYDGHRVLYKTGLAANSTWTVGTSLTHPWLVIVSGTGGTTAPDTGVRIAGFVALTANGDTAIITDPK